MSLRPTGRYIRGRKGGVGGSPPSTSRRVLPRIAEIKITDLNSSSIEATVKVVQHAAQHGQSGERLATRSTGQEIEESSLQMIGYMNLDEQADKDFGLARRKAVLRRIGARLRGDALSNRLLCFDEVRKISGAVGGVRRGRRTVPLGQIAGSAGRCSDFDRAFLPARASVSERWKRIDKAFHRAEEFPPVSLYKIGESYFVLDGNHRVSVYRYHGVEWVDADVTEFRGLLPRNRKVEGRPIHRHPSAGPERGGSKMHDIVDPQARIEVRWGLEEDEGGIAELMDLNGLHRALAFEERFLVAERGGKVLAALRYRTEPKRLLLGLLVSDPWAEERPLAVALYAGAVELAREMGVREVRARSVRHADDYPYVAGYRRRFPGGWYLHTQPRNRRKGLPAGGWRRMVALLSVPAVPFFRAFRGAGRWMDGPR